MILFEENMIDFRSLNSDEILYIVKSPALSGMDKKSVGTPDGIRTRDLRRERAMS